MRDAKGRFASTGSSGGKGKRTVRDYPKSIGTGKNRITRDNGGRITSVGGNGATLRGSRLKTEKGNTRKKVVRDLSIRNNTARKATREWSDALKKAGDISRPVALGGQGKRGSAASKAADAREQKAWQGLQAVKDSINARARGKSTISKPRGLKPDPRAMAKASGAKSAPKPKPAASATKVGNRINPAQKAIRQNKTGLYEARRTERQAWAVAMKNQSPPDSPARKKVNQNLNDAIYGAKAAQQQLREVRGQFPVQSKTQAIRAPRVKATIARNRPTAAQRNRAQANLERGTNRRYYTGKSAMRTRRTAAAASEFYANPMVALTKVRRGTNGFRLPRSMRRR